MYFGVQPKAATPLTPAQKAQQKALQKEMQVAPLTHCSPRPLPPTGPRRTEDTFLFNEVISSESRTGLPSPFTQLLMAACLIASYHDRV